MNQVDYPTFQTRYGQTLPVQNPTVGQGEQPAPQEDLVSPPQGNPWDLVQPKQQAPEAQPQQMAPPANNWTYEGK